MTEWPSEHRSRIELPQYYRQSSESTLGDVRTALILDAKEFSFAVECILEACGNQADPQSTISQLATSLKSEVGPHEDERSRNQFNDQMILACVEALRRAPTSDTWIYLWSMAWHSYSLHNALPKAVVLAASNDIQFKAQFLDIASQIIRQAAADPSRRETGQDRELFIQLRQNWLDNPNLTEIWWGLRRGHYHSFRGDDGIFQIVADIDLDAFIHLLSIFDNPYPVAAGLEAAGARSSFSKWKSLLWLAPVAFDDDGRWNGSPLVPLLLVIAREEIDKIRFDLRPDPGQHELTDIADGIRCLGAEVAKTLAVRSDGGPCAKRWASWLMRQTMNGVSNEPLPYPADARSRGYVDAILIDMLGRELGASFHNQLPPADPEPWESWCHRCVLVALALENMISMPDPENFLSQWELSPEDWESIRGRELRERASLFETFGKRPDAYGTRLLGYSLAEKSDPVIIWARLWSATLVVRNVVEFGDFSEDTEGERHGPGSASELIRLTFGLGLMMLERILDARREVSYERFRALNGLFPLLADAVKEMAAIDRLDRGYWSEAMRHLAVRRALWVARTPDADSAEIAFDPDSQPTLGDFLRELATDVENLLALLEAALRNGVGTDTLRRALDDAGVDLTVQIAFAKRLRATDQRRYPISDAQIAAGEALI